MSYLKTNTKNFTLDGNIFIPFSGSIYKFNGDHSWNNAYIDTVVANALQIKFNMLRFINFLPNNVSQTYNDEAVWTVIDYGLDKCRQNGLKVLLDLSDYRNLLLTQGIANPYAEDWSAFINFVVNRVNTVNAIAYKNDDTIAMWSIAGEPPSNMNASLVSFYDTVSTQIRSYDTNHIICPGGTEVYNPLSSISELTNIDCICSHSYIESEQLIRWPQMQTISNTYGKPWFVEEFGAAQGCGDVERSNVMRRMYNNGLRYGACGFSFWNFGTQVTVTSDDINTQTPLTHKMVRTYSHIKGYTFGRIPVTSDIENII